MKYLRVGLLAFVFAAMGAVYAQEQEPVDLASIQKLASQGEYDRAIQYLNEKIEADVNDIQSRFLKGMLLLEQEQTEAAQQTFLEIARQFPRLPESYNNLAAIYADEGEYEKARQALLSAIANAPEYAPVRVNLGDLYSKLALDAYRKALELNPGDDASEAKLRWIEQMFASGG